MDCVVSITHVRFCMLWPLAKLSHVYYSYAGTFNLHSCRLYAPGVIQLQCLLQGAVVLLSGFFYDGYHACMLSCCIAQCPANMAEMAMVAAGATQ